jgi:hypothetical protein
MGKYPYNFFAHLVSSDSVELQYRRSCAYIFYKPRVMREYGVGPSGRNASSVNKPAAIITVEEATPCYLAESRFSE